MNKFSEQEIIKLWRPFVVFFAFSFLVINWADVSWVFNYRVVSGFASGIFQTAGAENNGGEIAALRSTAPRNDRNQSTAPRNDERMGEIATSVASTLPPRNDRNQSTAPRDGEEKSDSVEIPKIGILAPLIFVSNSDNNYLHKKLDSGVVHYPGSAQPGEQGQTIILGHSAPANWPKIKHDWVFSDLNKLGKGDQIILYYNHQKYIYSVTRKVFLNKGEEMPENDLTNNKNTLISISCWPPGKDYKRIAVESVLID